MFRFALLGVVGMIAAVGGSDTPPPREVADVAALVRQLGSPDFAEREAATDKLSRLPVDEPPAELLAALKSPDPEVRDRAAKAVKAIRAAAPLRHLTRDERFAARGQADLFIASTAALKLKPEDQRLWVPALKLGVRAVEQAEMTGDRKPHGGPTWFVDFPTYRSKLNPTFLRTDGGYVRPKADARGNLVCIDQAAVQAAEVKAEFVLAGFVVSRGQVSAGGSITNSVILANGDVTAESGILNSVVICDGNVTAGHVRKSLIIARGKIDGGEAFGSTLVAGGTVEALLPREQRDPPPIPAGINPAELKALLALREIKRVEVCEKERHPLGFITFFELSTVGLEVKVAENVVSVAKVAEGKLFAKAGLEVGDIITAVNGKKPDSAESLRRLLRAALALGDATVTLKRGDKSETVKVSLPE